MGRVMSDHPQLGLGSDARILAAGRCRKKWKWIGLAGGREPGGEIRGKASFPIQVSRDLIIFVCVSLLLLCR